MATTAEDLRKKVAKKLDPPSLSFYGKRAEFEQWLEGDEAVRSRLEKRWNKKYLDHQKRTKARRAAERVEEGAA